MNHIVYITDENYILPTLVSLNSLCANASTDTIAHIISVDISEQSYSQLQKIQSEKVSLQIHSFKKDTIALDVEHAYVSKAALLKFRLPEIFANLDRLLYIDGDIILNRGFEKIFEYDISNYYAACVQDMIAVVRDKWNEKIGHKKYFNSGVMFINLNKLRSNNCSQKFFDYKKKEIEHTFMDQNALNAVLGENILWLDCRFNFLVDYYRVGYSINQIGLFFSLTEEQKKQCEELPFIMHFAGSKKVWKNVSVKYFDEWIKFADNTLILPLVKNYCRDLTTRLNDTEIKLKALEKKLNYVQHRTFFGAFQWLLRKIFFFNKYINKKEY